jgi:branched-subunit amino acid aminotransferase/4-amino-4-deoxychorismate lyase
VSSSEQQRSFVRRVCVLFLSSVNMKATRGASSVRRMLRPMDERDDFQLIETMLHTHKEGFYLLDGHLRRLRRSAQALGFTCPDEPATRRRLDAESCGWPRGDASRVRLLLSRRGTLHIERTGLPDVRAHPPVCMPGQRGPGLTVRLDPAATDSKQFTLRHKTTSREAYAAARARAGVRGDGRVFDVLMFNERMEMTETSIANVAVQAGDR